MFFGLLYFCVVILCVNRSCSSFILYRIVKRHRHMDMHRQWFLVPIVTSPEEKLRAVPPLHKFKWPQSKRLFL